MLKSQKLINKKVYYFHVPVIIKHELIPQYRKGHRNCFIYNTIIKYALLTHYSNDKVLPQQI